jgi:CRP/FNR family transcriptional regulator
MISETQYKDPARSYPVLSHLPWDLQRELTRDGQFVEFPEGETLFDVQSLCSLFLMVTSGTIRVIISTSTGREILLYRVQAGEACVLTVSCLLGNSDYPARGLAETPLQGVAIKQSLFTRLVTGCPPFREFAFRFFGDRLTRLMTLIEEVAFGKMDQRLASLLLTKGVSMETTHQILADELGSVREVVSRILKDFEGQGILELERGQIRVLDQEALRRIARPSV